MDSNKKGITKLHIFGLTSREDKAVLCARSSSLNPQHDSSIKSRKISVLKKSVDKLDNR